MPGTQSTRVEMTGRKIGLWTVLRYAGKKLWECRCDCGTVRNVLGASLRSEVSTSCGCLRMDHMRTATVTHGMYRESIYKRWVQMIQRCHNPNCDAFESYGGRGITVCERWRNSFENFFADVGQPPSPRHSLDRFPNNDGNYEPGNVRWATPREQLLNRRNNRRFEVRGESLTLSELCDKYGQNEATAEKRLRLGWNIKDALFTKVDTKFRNKLCRS